MKTLTRTMKYVAAIACASLMAANVQAITINDPGVVGTIKSGEPASIDDEVYYINTLLAQPANNGGVSIDGGGSIGVHIYTTSSTEYNGSVSAVGAFRLEVDISAGVPNPAFTLNVPAGWDYVLAKYDGPNGGDVVWYLGGAAITLPSDSSPLWVNKSQNGYGISHWTVFNGNRNVPDGGSMLVLLGGAVTVLGFLRRKVSA